jgi:hypothetical protein
MVVGGTCMEKKLRTLPVLRSPARATRARSSGPVPPSGLASRRGAALSAARRVCLSCASMRSAVRWRAVEVGGLVSLERRGERVGSLRRYGRGRVRVSQSSLTRSDSLSLSLSPPAPDRRLTGQHIYDTDTEHRAGRIRQWYSYSISACRSVGASTTCSDGPITVGAGVAVVRAVPPAPFLVSSGRATSKTIHRRREGSHGALAPPRPSEHHYLASSLSSGGAGSSSSTALSVG